MILLALPEPNRTDNEGQVKVSQQTDCEKCGEDNNMQQNKKVCVRVTQDVVTQRTENVVIWKFPCSSLSSFH